MANIRQNVGSGGLYPTGRSPLSVDLATPMTAIVQRRIKREEQRIEQEKETISENQAAILKALDFETVQGLSDKIQEQHLENLNGISDRWAERFAAADGKLSFQDKKDLLADKRKVEGDLGKMQADVKMFAQAQNLLNTKPQLWDEQSWTNLANYAKEGKIGSGEAINILVPRQPDFVEHMQTNYKTQLANLEKRMSRRMLGVNTEEGRILGEKDNLQAAKDMWESFKNQADVRKFIDKKGEDVIKEEFMNMWGFSLKDDKFNQTVWKESNKTTGTDNYWNRKYGWGATSKEQLDNIVFRNEIAERVLRRDKDIMKYLRGSVVKGLGPLGGIGFTTDSDGTEVLALRGQGDDPKAITIAIPSDRSDETAVKAFKQRLLNYFEVLGGKQIGANEMGTIAADFDDVPDDIFPMRTNNLQVIDNLLRKGDKSPLAPKEDSKGRMQSASDEYKKKYSEIIIGRLKKEIPEYVAEFEHETNVIGRKKDKVIKVIDKETGESLIYDLSKEEDRKKLADWAEGKIDYEGRVRKSTAIKSKDKPKTVEQAGVIYDLNEKTGEYEPRE